MIVIDFTVLACLLINDPRSHAARKALATDPDWVSAPIWRQQFLDVLVGHMLRGLPIQSILEKLAAADFTVRTSHERLADRDVMELSRQSKLSASQVIYVLVARKLGATLVTADVQIADQFPNESKLIESFITE